MDGHRPSKRRRRRRRRRSSSTVSSTTVGGREQGSGSITLRLPPHRLRTFTPSGVITLSPDPERPRTFIASNQPAAAAPQVTLPPRIEFHPPFQAQQTNNHGIATGALTGEDGDWFAADIGNLWHSPLGPALVKPALNVPGFQQKAADVTRLQPRVPARPPRQPIPDDSSVRLNTPVIRRPGRSLPPVPPMVFGDIDEPLPPMRIDNSEGYEEEEPRYFEEAFQAVLRGRGMDGEVVEQSGEQDDEGLVDLEGDQGDDAMDLD
jgi:hypothetical protein